MRVNRSGYDLIKHFEGFRARAYRDAVGVWTIGYGHTSAAGMPKVKEGDQITQAEGMRILENDLQGFARGVAASCQGISLLENQFSALVSFAYNVGLGNFDRSSVLDAVLRGDFEAVPRRLSLWVKAGGKTLPGLVKRRTSEGILFSRDYRNMALFTQGLPDLSDYEADQCLMARGAITPARAKDLSQSTTVWATLAGAAAGISATVREITYALTDVRGIVPETALPWVLCAMIIVAAAIWVIRERKRRLDDDGI